MAVASRALARFRLVLWILVAIAAVLATVLFVFRPFSPQGPGTASCCGPLANPGQNFTLAATSGDSFTREDFQGTPSLVFFGYTFCPDVCPTTLAEATAWRAAAGLSPEQLRIVFVTVDPARDTLDVLGNYLSAFDPSVVGLVGDDQETQAIKAAFGAYGERAEGDPNDPNYLVNHTASLFLIDKDGNFQGTIADGENSETALAKIRRLIDA